MIEQPVPRVKSFFQALEGAAWLLPSVQELLGLADPDADLFAFS